MPLSDEAMGQILFLVVFISIFVEEAIELWRKRK